MTDSVKVSEEARKPPCPLLDELEARYETWARIWQAGRNPLPAQRAIQPADNALRERIASLEADRRRMDKLETLADMGSLHMGGRVHLFRPSLGLWELFDTLREAADAALTTQQAGEE